MARRNFRDIETSPLVGGALCLDFTNTTGARASASPRERLRSYADLLVFCRRAPVLDTANIELLSRHAKENPDASRWALTDMLQVREILYRLFASIAQERQPAVDDFNKALAQCRQKRLLQWTRGGPVWTWEFAPSDMKAMEGPILHSAQELLASAEIDRIRKCGECDWLFLDTTRNASRRWCKAACGDRVKARRYYRRHRENAPE